MRFSRLASKTGRGDRRFSPTDLDGGYGVRLERRDLASLFTRLPNWWVQAASDGNPPTTDPDDAHLQSQGVFIQNDGMGGVNTYTVDHQLGTSILGSGGSGIVVSSSQFDHAHADVSFNPGGVAFGSPSRTATGSDDGTGTATWLVTSNAANPLATATFDLDFNPPANDFGSFVALAFTSTQFTVALSTLNNTYTFTDNINGITYTANDGSGVIFVDPSTRAIHIIYQITYAAPAQFTQSVNYASTLTTGMNIGFGGPNPGTYDSISSLSWTFSVEVT